ncbi:PREDICTED: melatonin receptor type 1A-like [Acropora digitifera]|uniref:melatonin receptor type 1A-like n=1 Tax=Acropora digitifera TaxID=70779 RepID=UPI00077B1115|nr:PREDICTED: melatonin receptor type 1A-like [Acropora digitifera]
MTFNRYSKLVVNQATLTELLCSAQLTEGIHNELRWISFVNILLSITTVFGNATVLLALSKVSALHPASKLLFRTLAATDFCVGVISQPLTIVSIMSQVHGQFNVCRYASTVRFLTSYVLCTMSLLTTAAINLDRLLALSLRLRYRQFVTLKRMYVIVTAFWVLTMAFSVMSLISARITSWFFNIVLLSCFIISGISYAKIFRILHHNQTQVNSLSVYQMQPNPDRTPNTEVYKKTVCTIFWVQIGLVVCYVPFIIIGLILRKNQTTPIVLAWRCAGTLLFFNSSLNPVLYCWKMSSVKTAMKETVRKICCNRSS